MTTETPKLTDAGDGEDVKVTQRMAVDALAIYAREHANEKVARKSKEVLSKEVLKPWLAANQGETLYDGESGLEARLTPHGEPRWLDTKDMTSPLAIWALEAGLLKLDLTAVDKRAKGDPEFHSDAFKTFFARIHPGGEGEPRLSVSRRESAE